MGNNFVLLALEGSGDVLRSKKIDRDMLKLLLQNATENFDGMSEQITAAVVVGTAQGDTLVIFTAPIEPGETDV